MTNANSVSSSPAAVLHRRLDPQRVQEPASPEPAHTRRNLAAPPSSVPIEVLESLLREHVADQAAIITASASTPLAHQGANDSTAFLAAFWSNELADYDFEHYQAAGGSCADAAEWRRSYGLGLVAGALAQMPFTHGRMLRSIRGDLAPPQIAGVSEAVVRQSMSASLPMMEQMVELVIREARRWLA
jgi:hypothetical protein